MVRMNARLEPIEYEDANPRLRALYDTIMARTGLSFVPRWFRYQGAVPDLLEANWAKVEATLLSGTLPRLLKELIIYNVAREQRCTYCSFMHEKMADLAAPAAELGGAFRVADGLDSSALPSSYKTAIRVVTRLALAPLETRDEDIEELRDEGFSNGEIQELVAQADLALVFITVAEIFGLEIDSELMSAFHDAPSERSLDSV